MNCMGQESSTIISFSNSCYDTETCGVCVADAWMVLLLGKY